MAALEGPPLTASQLVREVEEGVVGAWICGSCQEAMGGEVAPASAAPPPSRTYTAKSHTHTWPLSTAIHAGLAGRFICLALPPCRCAHGPIPHPRAPCRPPTGLAERFIYLNDDMLLARPLAQEEAFSPATGKFKAMMLK